VKDLLTQILQVITEALFTERFTINLYNIYTNKNIIKYTLEMPI